MSAAREAVKTNIEYIIGGEPNLTVNWGNNGPISNDWVVPISADAIRSAGITCKTCECYIGNPTHVDFGGKYGGHTPRMVCAGPTIEDFSMGEYHGTPSPDFFCAHHSKLANK